MQEFLSSSEITGCLILFCNHCRPCLCQTVNCKITIFVDHHKASIALGTVVHHMQQCLYLPTSALVIRCQAFLCRLHQERHYTHTQPFYGPFSGTTRVSRCQKRTSGLWCKGRLTEADIQTIRLSATPYGLTSAHLHHLPIFFTGRMPFLPPNQQRRSTEGNWNVLVY